MTKGLSAIEVVRVHSISQNRLTIPLSTDFIIYRKTLGLAQAPLDFRHFIKPFCMWYNLLKQVADSPHGGLRNSHEISLFSYDSGNSQPLLHR